NDEQEVRIEEKFQDVDRKNGNLPSKAEKKDIHETTQNFSDCQMIAAQAVKKLTNATKMADHSPSNDENSPRGNNSSPGNARKE
ncbi:hypothetical protein JHU04_004614, partial [Brenneria sp. 4F2]|nr:hypothetical protein [Brenneria bubanii]